MMTLSKHGLHIFILLALLYFVTSIYFFTGSLDCSKNPKKVEYNISTEFMIYMKQKTPQNTFNCIPKSQVFLLLILVK